MLDYLLVFVTLTPTETAARIGVVAYDDDLLTGNPEDYSINVLMVDRERILNTFDMVDYSADHLSRSEPELLAQRDDVVWLVLLRVLD